MRTFSRVLPGALVALFCASVAMAQVNTTPFQAAGVTWGQKVSSLIGPGASTEFWFAGIVRPGRSYCVEAGNFEGAVPGTSTFGDHVAFVNLSVYLNDSTTLIVSRNGAAEEPFGFGGARACWIATVIDTNRIKLTPQVAVVPATAQYLTLHFVETTLFCPWFFIAGDYNAFSLIRNASLSTLSGVVVTWRGINGAVAGTTTVSVPPNGAIVLNARDFVDPAIFSNGTIEIAHAGSPGQLSGSTTTLSGTTGIGFDADFKARPTW